MSKKLNTSKHPKRHSDHSTRLHSHERQPDRLHKRDLAEDNGISGDPLIGPDEWADQNIGIRNAKRKPDTMTDTILAQGTPSTRHDADRKPITRDLHLTFEALDAIWNPAVREIALLLHQHNYEIRIVGGAPRDILLGIKPRDIDLATNAEPDTMIYLFQAAGLTIDVDGIQHGTIKVMGSDKRTYEITTLDYWLDPTDHKILRTIHLSWYQDAMARDFTINTMSMDQDGIIWDYIGGMADLRAGRIRSLGNFEEKITKRPILILRFFKLLNKFEHAKYPRSYREIVGRHVELINEISGHRQWLELKDILDGQHAKKVFILMDTVGLLDAMGLQGFVLDSIKDPRSIDPVSIIGWLVSSEQLEALSRKWEWELSKILRASWIHSWRGRDVDVKSLLGSGVDPEWVEDLLNLKGESELAQQIPGMKPGELFGNLIKSQL